MKIFWGDTETTGVEPLQNAMVQLGGIIEVNGVVKERVELLFRPFKDDVIEERALEINKRTHEEIAQYPDPAISILSLKKTFAKYIDKFDKADKFVFAGFNVGFDVNFVRRTFQKTGDPYYGSWFFNCDLDVRSFVAKHMLQHGLRLPNYKLVTICEHFNIPIPDAHNATADVEATRDLYYFLERYGHGNPDN